MGMDTTQAHAHNLSWQHLINVLHFPAPLTTRDKVVQGVRPVPWALPPSTPVRSLPRDADANADAMRYSGIARAASHPIKRPPPPKLTRKESRAARQAAWLVARDRDRAGASYLGYRHESQPISVTPTYRQQLANMARHARLPKPSKVKVAPME